VSTIADLLIKVRADTGAPRRTSRASAPRWARASARRSSRPRPRSASWASSARQAFDNLQDGARNAKQTEAVLKSTGDASNVTAKHVDDLAMSLRRKAGVDDDVVHSGENMLLTFTNVRNEVGKGNDIFDQATKTMLDMSHAWASRRRRPPSSSARRSTTRSRA
jgi:hypothetical protein